MVRQNDLQKMREELEMLEALHWASGRGIPGMPEVCAVCDAFQESNHLVKCEGCGDVYVCREGPCAHLHEVQAHPALSRLRS